MNSRENKIKIILKITSNNLFTYDERDEDKEKYLEVGQAESRIYCHLSFGLSMPPIWPPYLLP